MRIGLILTLFIILIIISCKHTKPQQVAKNSENTTRLEIQISENLETLALIFNLSEAGDIQFNGNPAPRAMLSRTLTKEFAQFKNHEAVNIVNYLLNNDFVDLYDILLSLYFTPLPEFKQYSEFPSIYYENDSLSPAEVKAVFRKFAISVGQFYKDAHMHDFFNQSGKPLYDKLRKEVDQVKPDNRYIGLMESYYGIRRISYHIIVSALSFNGIGRSKTITTKEGKNVYQFVSSNPKTESDTIDLQHLDSFTLGYTDKNYFREIAIHELGHSFFQESLRENQVLREKLKEIDYLFTDSLRNDMLKQGYADWPMCFEEHLVRLGEIKMAELVGDKNFALAYKNECMNQRGFVYMSEMKSILTQYDSNRNTYPTIEDFIPVLIDSLKSRHTAKTI